MAVSLGKFAPQQAGYFYFGAVSLLKLGTISLEYLKEVMPVQASLRLYFLGLTTDFLIDGRRSTIGGLRLGG